MQSKPKGQQAVKPVENKFYENMRKVGYFNSVFQFVRLQKNVPHSNLLNFFYDYIKGEQHSYLIKGEMMRVNSISLFKSGIKPAWEDEINGKGGDFYFRFSDMVMDIREIWERMISELVCESFPHIDKITGIRAIDQCKFGRLKYKLEIWTYFNSEDNDAGRELREFITDKFINKDPQGKPDQELFFQSHSTSVQNHATY